MLKIFSPRKNRAAQLLSIKSSFKKSALAIVILLTFIITACAVDSSGSGIAAQQLLSKAYFTNGSKILKKPAEEFYPALCNAAFPTKKDRRIVAISIADSFSISNTVPYFLKSLSKISVNHQKHEPSQRNLLSSQHLGQDSDSFDYHPLMCKESQENQQSSSLDSHTVIICTEKKSHEKCQKLPYKHQCVLDVDSPMIGGTYDMEFQAMIPTVIGFAKVKHTLDALLSDFDVVLMDSDVVVQHDIFSFLTSIDADVAKSIKDCIAVDEMVDLKPQGTVGATDVKGNVTGGQQEVKKLMRFNGAMRQVLFTQGITYIRSSDISRLFATRWIRMLLHQIKSRPRRLPHEVFNMLAPAFAGIHSLSLRALPPDKFFTSCTGCGCRFLVPRNARGRVPTHVLYSAAIASKDHLVRNLSRCLQRDDVEAYVAMRFGCLGSPEVSGKLMQQALTFRKP